MTRTVAVHPRSSCSSSCGVLTLAAVVVAWLVAPGGDPATCYPSPFGCGPSVKTTLGATAAAAVVPGSIGLLFIGFLVISLLRKSTSWGGVRVAVVAFLCAVPVPAVIATAFALLAAQ